MKILLNLTTLNRGGALQSSVSFLENLNLINDMHTWYIAYSKSLQPIILNNVHISKNEKLTFVELEKSPAKNVKSRNQLQKLERTINPDIIFTYFGPSYVKFKKVHVCGVADGWVTHSNLLAFKVSYPNRLQWVKVFLKIIYKVFWFRRADAWIVEAECAKEGMVSRLKVDRRKIRVIHNTCRMHYLSNNEYSQWPKSDQVCNLLVFGATYFHKNLMIIPDIAKKLDYKTTGRMFRFNLTLERHATITRKVMERAQSFGVSQMIVNLGPIDLSDGPKLYKMNHICFFPTVLETFSATYPEAMASRIPIVTSDLSFAHDVCKSAALYFDPENPTDAAAKILSLVENENLFDQLVSEGLKRIKEFPTPLERTKQIVSFLEEVCELYN